MPGAEAIAAIQLVEACIGIAKTIIDIGRAVSDAQGLPPELRDLLEKLPVIEELLESAHENLEEGKVTEDVSKSAQPIIKQCEQALGDLKEILQKACPEDGDNRSKRILKGAKTVFSGRDSQVQKLLKGLQDNLKLLEQKGIYVNGAKLDGLQELKYNYLPPEQAETPAPPTSNVPFRRDPHFIERGDLLDQISAKVSQPAARVALVGLGGIGKTQLAIEYCYRLEEQSQDLWVLWIHASTAARFEQGVREIADLVKIQDRNDPKANVFELVRDWLRSRKSGRWVLVLDNLDDAGLLLEPRYSGRGTQKYGNGSDALFGYLPVCEHGSILITTQSKDAAGKLVEYTDIIDVGTMKDSDALRLLEKKLGDRVDIADGLDLATALGYLPLALTQAAAYLTQMGHGCSIGQYVEKLRKSDRSENSILDREARNSISRACQISFEHIHNIRPSAAELLSLMGFCDGQAIPEALVRRRDSNEDAGAQETNLDRSNNGSGDGSSGLLTAATSLLLSESEDDLDDAFDKDLRMLERYSFVSPTTDPSVSKMHRSVQVATRQWLNSQGQLEQWKERYIDSLWTLFPPGSYENWSQCQIYYPHARSVVKLKPKRREALLKWATIMYNAAWYALMRIGADEAEKMAVESLTAMVRMLGEYDNDALRSQEMLALVKTSRGRWKEAEQLQVQVIERKTKVLGAEHPNTLTSISNLASTYRDQGRWKEAEMLQVQVTEKRKKMLGAEHPDTLASVSNLALIYSNQGRWGDAETLQMQVMETSKKMLGVEHPNTLTSMNNLALIYRDQGRWKESEELELLVFEVMKTVLGETHPNTLTSMKNLALLYANGSRWKEAEELQLIVSKASKEVFGPEHPLTLGAIGNLASTYRGQARFKEAEELEMQVIAISKRILGEEHPSTLTSMANMASTYIQQGRFVDAAALDRKVIELRRKVLGDLHPSTVRVMHRLALTYQRSMQFQHAEELELQVLKIRIKTLGQTHPDTLGSVSALASIRNSQRQQSSQKAKDGQSSSESSLDGTSPRLSASSPTSYLSHELGAMALVTDCLTSDPDLMSLYTEVATTMRQAPFLRKIAEALEHLSQDLIVEAPSSLKPHFATLLGSKRRRQLALTKICDRLKLLEPVSVDLAEASNEAQSEQLGINTIKWIEDVSSSNTLEPRELPIMQLRPLEDGESQNPDSDTESDESDEAVNEPSRNVLEQASTFVAGSASFKSYKYRIGLIIHPYFQLDVTLAENDVNAARDLLDEKFDAIAKGPWKWLHELRDMGFSMTEIAELLLEERNDHPWIYFNPWMDDKQKPHLGLHIPRCVHRGGQSAAGTQDDQDEQLSVLDVNDCVGSIREDVAALCGLAGVVPPADRHTQWNGEVVLENDTAASITYHTEGASPGIVWHRIQDALNSFCAAFAAVQQSGKCCDSFTLLRHSSPPRVGNATFIELSNLDMSLVMSLCNSLESSMENTDEGMQQGCAENATKILALVSNGYTDYAGSLGRPSEEQCLHLCALAVQVLCLSYVSYCQAHTGALQLFFLQHTLSEVRLFGARAPKNSPPDVVARLQNLTCIGAMLHDSVFVLGPTERGNGDREAATKFDLLACPQDIIDTWGPGNFAVATDTYGEQRIARILVGGGSIYLAAEQSDVYHWSPDLHQVFDGEPTMSLTEKIIIAASVVINPNCGLNDDDFMRICEEFRDPLGTFEPYWAMVEQQAGVQAGQYLNMIYNHTWAKKTGRTLKELQMLKPMNEVIPFLESTWGLQVSLCTGLARRVKMRELLADVLPAFVERKIPAPPEWTELRDSHGILDILRQGDLAAWLNEIAKHAPCYDLTCALIRSIPMLLHDTGLDPSGTHFVVAWVHSKSHLPLQCIKLRVENANFWTRVLQDSGDCATFAYFTTTCLEIQGHGCRNVQPLWHGEMVLLETEVQRHVDRIHKHTTLEWPWCLEDGQSYPIGRLQTSSRTQLRALVQLSDPSQTPRLIVSRSEIATAYLLRILRKQSRPERIRERQTSADQVQRAFIASRNVEFKP